MGEAEATPLTDARLVAWVRQAAPYIHAFRGRAFVIAFGGEALTEGSAQALIHDIALLDSMGIQLVLVHGARPQIDAEMASRHLTPRFHNGLRVTDAATLECVKRAMGVTRIEIEAMLSQGLPNTPLAGAFLRVTGGNFISAKPVGVVDGIDFQFTGAVRKVEAEEIRADLAQENVVLITPIAASPSGEIFNLAWEEVAEAVATAIKADKLIFLCDAPGIVDQAGKQIDALTVEEAEQLLAKKVKQSAEVTRVLPGALRACKNGVGRVHFLDRGQDGAMLMELFTREGIGTVVTRAPLARLREATPEDVGAVLNLIAPLEADGTLVKRGRERIEREIGHFSLLDHDGVVVGCAALYPLSQVRGEPATAELACLAVLPEYRREGYGDQLRRHIEARAKAMKIKRLCVLTTRTAHWFVERGYAEAGIDALPQSRRELYNWQRRSKVLVKNL
ncbi:MAG: amino-acid N-acetyltransferase [Rhodocyclaceae bacterium]|nr:amino-acid N-acetyltransferase [Rhodocyclaceae bacterium]